MRLYKLLSAAGIEIPNGVSDIEISEIVTNSKKVTRGCMFVCISGLHYDGHDFIKNAVDAGASVIVCEALRDECVGGAAAIIVKNTRHAVAHLYNAWHGDPASKMKIIGVTGTNGKTTVTYMLKQLFERCGCRCGIVGTLGCLSGGRQLGNGSADTLANMTTPDPEVLYGVLAEMVSDGIEYLFIEATSHASALSKLDAVEFDTLVFTNLTQDHLDFHGTMEEYLSAKAKLFGRCRRAVINLDDRYAAEILAASRAEKNLLCSTKKEENTDFFASDICFGNKTGVKYKVTQRAPLGEEIFGVDLPSFFGGFSVMNSLEAVAVAREYGFSAESIKKALCGIHGIPGRMQRVMIDENASFSVFIDYAHTPDAIENVLRTARELGGEGRLILLFGCGGERDRSKRKLMANIASRLSDLVIITSDNSRSEDKMQIISDIYRGIDKEKEHIIIPDREAAIRYAVKNARSRDIIILAGKGHEKYEINETGRHPFDEEKIVKEAVAEFLG